MESWAHLSMDMGKILLSAGRTLKSGWPAEDLEHSQPFIASNRPKQGIKLGLKLLILATCDPNGDQMKVAFHQ